MARDVAPGYEGVGARKDDDEATIPPARARLAASAAAERLWKDRLSTSPPPTAPMSSEWGDGAVDMAGMGPRAKELPAELAAAVAVARADPLKEPLVGRDW